MAGKKISDLVSRLAVPICENYSFELVDVEFIKEGAYWYLRVYIDKPGGISIDDCQMVSEKLSEKLDKADPIEQSYFLEVSSPGLDRPLKTQKDFEKYRGELVEVKLYQPLDGKRVYEGDLEGLIDNKVVIKLPDGLKEFEKEKIALVRRVVKF
jgi:ribosome maturation factor RimP